MYLGSRFESGELWRSDVGSVVQQVVFCSLSGVQEVQTALVTAEHILLLQRHKQSVTCDECRLLVSITSSL